MAHERLQLVILPKSDCILAPQQKIFNWMACSYIYMFVDTHVSCWHFLIRSGISSIFCSPPEGHVVHFDTNTNAQVRDIAKQTILDFEPLNLKQTGPIKLVLTSKLDWIFHWNQKIDNHNKKNNIKKNNKNNKNRISMLPHSYRPGRGWYETVHHATEQSHLMCMALTPEHPYPCFFSWPPAHSPAAPSPPSQASNALRRFSLSPSGFVPSATSLSMHTNSVSAAPSFSHTWFQPHIISATPNFRQTHCQPHLIYLEKIRATTFRSNVIPSTRISTRPNFNQT